MENKELSTSDVIVNVEHIENTSENQPENNLTKYIKSILFISLGFIMIAIGAILFYILCKNIIVISNVYFTHIITSFMILIIFVVLGIITYDFGLKLCPRDN